MPYETLRFLHAARVFVDHPLHDTGPLQPELRGLARDATTLAFQHLIRACLDHDVDFLLLTGDSLEQSDFSISARVALRHGFEQLDEAGIQVFLVPGPSDPASVWDDVPELPGNVTVFRPETDDPVAVLRDGAVIASIRSLSWRQSWFAWDDDEPQADRAQRRAKEADTLEADAGQASSCAAPTSQAGLELEQNDNQPAETNTAERAESHRETRRVHSPAELRPNHFAIAIVRDGVDQPNGDPQADYLAVVGGCERTTINGGDWLLHFPGGTQSLSPREPGARGCSLVELDDDGVIRCRFVPTASVRWDARDIDITADTTLADLANDLRSACRELWGTTEARSERKVIEFGDAADENESAGLRTLPQSIPDSPHAQAGFWQWTIRGHGPLFQTLFEESTQAELIDRLEDDVDWPLDLPRLHRFRLLATEANVPRAATEDESPVDESETLDVPAEYMWRVDQAQPLGASAWSDLGQESSTTRQRLSQVESAGSNCDAAVVMSLARRRGWKWFAATPSSLH